jgi:cellulose synthase/poly-beta-1,6-N-acetylglucosamine synthase-like glycosyltransferase
MVSGLELFASALATALLVIEGLWIVYTTRTPKNAGAMMTTPATYGTRRKICIIFPTYKDVVDLDKWLEWSKGEPVKYVIAEDGTKNNDRWIGKATVIHRTSRSGFKAGGVNHTLDVLVESGENFDYVMLFDSDHIPYNSSIKDIYGYLNKEFIQFFWLDGLPLTSILNWLTYSSRYYSNWNLYNRAFPNLTGSAIAIRYDLIKEDGLRFPETITEDYALTLFTIYRRKLRVTVIPFVISIGSSPLNFNVYLKQQLRWAEGTIRDGKRFFWNVLSSKTIKLRGKLDFLFHMNLYLQGVWTIFTLSLLITGLGISVVMIPLLIFQAIAYFRTLAKTPKRYWPVYFFLNYFMALVQFYALLRGLFLKKGHFVVTQKREAGSVAPQ